MDRILITGGCGFIGTNLVAHLTDRRLARVRVLDNLSVGRVANLSHLDVECVRGDVRNREEVANAMEGVSGVVHLAAGSGVVDSIASPRENFQVNVMGTFNVLEAARSLGVRTIVNASTAGAIVGNAKPPISEQTPPAPLSPYGASKLAAEAYCSAFAGSYGLETVSLRFTNVYGRHSHHKGSVIALFIKQILAREDLTIFGDGGQQRDFLHVDDLCSTIVTCLQRSPALAGEVLQLGTGDPVSVNELVDLLREIAGEAFPISAHHKEARRGEVTHSWADCSKAKRLLDFQPKTSLREGLSHTWKWFQAASQE